MIIVEISTIVSIYNIKVFNKKGGNMTHKEDNYLMLNGKKVYFTEEQIKTLGLEEPEPKDIFDVKPNHYSLSVDYNYTLLSGSNYSSGSLNKVWVYPKKYENLVKQIAYDRELHDRLLRYSLNHGGDEIDWSKGNNIKYKIFYEKTMNKFKISEWQYCIDLHSVHFNTEKTAKDAIEEVIKPFLKEHPDYTAYKDGFHL